MWLAQRVYVEGAGVYVEGAMGCVKGIAMEADSAQDMVGDAGVCSGR